MEPGVASDQILMERSIMMMPASIKLSLPDAGRIIAISDVHGNLPYLKGLLAKLSLRDEDTLVFCGDIMEKGPHSLETLRFLMDLTGARRCLFVLGNCDYWYDDTTAPSPARTGTSSDYLLTDGTASGPACWRRCARRRASRWAGLRHGRVPPRARRGASPPSSSSSAGCRSS